MFFQSVKRFLLNIYIFSVQICTYYPRHIPHFSDTQKKIEKIAVYFKKTLAFLTKIRYAKEAITGCMVA